MTHRLLLAAASPLARLVLGVDPEDHLVLPGVKVAEVQELLDGLCSGKLERSSDLLPLLTMLCIIGDEDDSEDMEGEGDESFLEPVLHMNIGEAMSGEGGTPLALLQDQQDGCFSSDYDNLASDADGRYRGMDQAIHRNPGYTNYTVFSLWDTFRAQHPLYTLIDPQLDQAWIRSLLQKYDESIRDRP